MKQLSNEIKNLLNRSALNVCDLYTLTLLDGSVYRFASHDTDVVFDGLVYKAKPFLWKRDRINIQGSPSVDTLSVTVYADRFDSLSLNSIASFKKSCHEGDLDAAYLKLSRAYFDGGICVGTFDLFEGQTEVTSVGGLQVKLSCKSVMQGLAGLIPARIFASQSAYSMNGEGIITTTESDICNMVIPLKPSSNVLVQV